MIWKSLLVVAQTVMIFLGNANSLQIPNKKVRSSVSLNFFTLQPMQTYQLFINLAQTIEIQIGKLGLCTFPKGVYVYTGSAKRNMERRITRHFSKDKNLHWHIDYLLANEQTKIVKVIKSELEECELNADTKGKTIVKGFGSSDCKNNCKSHLILWKEITTS